MDPALDPDQPMYVGQGKYVGQDQSGLTELRCAVGRCTVVVTGGGVAGSVAGDGCRWWIQRTGRLGRVGPLLTRLPLPLNSEAAGCLEPAGACSLVVLVMYFT